MASSSFVLRKILADHAVAHKENNTVPQMQRMEHLFTIIALLSEKLLKEAHCKIVTSFII
jgi:hypothetical protein